MSKLAVQKYAFLDVVDGGRPGTARHKPTIHTRAKVMEMACLSEVTHEDIALSLNINVKTLRKYYNKELNNVLHSRNAKLSRGLYKDALAGCKKSRMFWLQHRSKSFNNNVADEKIDDVQTALTELQRIMLSSSIASANDPTKSSA